MSNTIATDILDYENILRDAGIPDKHATAHARATAKFMENNLATKEDLTILYLKITITLGGIVGIMLTIGLSILGYFLKHQ